MERVLPEWITKKSITPTKSNNFRPLFDVTVNHYLPDESICDEQNNISTTGSHSQHTNNNENNPSTSVQRSQSPEPSVPLFRIMTPSTINSRAALFNTEQIDSGADNATNQVESSTSNIRTELSQTHSDNVDSTGTQPQNDPVTESSNNNQPSKDVKPDISVLNVNSSSNTTTSTSNVSTSNDPTVNVKKIIKTEVKSEPADSSTSNLRPSCNFGIRCYRQNADHRTEFAHPGDTDYRRPEFPSPPAGTPDCPFGASCYRRNPEHFQRLNHPPSSIYHPNVPANPNPSTMPTTPAKKRPRNRKDKRKNKNILSTKRVRRTRVIVQLNDSNDDDDYDTEDPFINDDSSDDYHPSDDSDDDDDYGDSDDDNGVPVSV